MAQSGVDRDDDLARQGRDEFANDHLEHELGSVSGLPKVSGWGDLDTHLGKHVPLSADILCLVIECLGDVSLCQSFSDQGRVCPCMNFGRCEDETRLGRFGK
jgi:hypothetical protein